ncbi:transmembrane protein [Ceratobasidium sp. AG-Ba]|nr:transmembrane protein [Ceratobasidium sp. AG-Ba]
MSHITRGDSPDSSTESLQHSLITSLPSPGPATTGDKDRKPLSTGVESPYWDPYAGHSASREHHEAGDSIPLVAFQPHYSQFVESTNSPQVQTPTPLLLHALLCFGAFPLVFLVSRAASGMSLFWTRLIVGGLCGGVGLTLGVSLIDLSRRSMEAALWAIIIHESMKGEIQEDLDYHTANPLSPRSERSTKTVPHVQETQTAEYYETTVVGDVTPEEIARAASQLNDTFSQVKYTWTITPLSSSAHIPTDRYFAFNRTANVNGTATIITDTIHFAETFPDQLAPPNQHPAGFGTFLNQSEVGGMSAADIEDSSARKLGAGPTTRAVGQIVRWPRWGSRIKCQLIEDLGRYLTPHSPIVNMTYLYVPWTAVNSIFDTMGLPAPNATAFPPVNFTSFMEGNNTPQVTVTEQEIAMTFKWWDNGVSHSFAYQPVSRGDDGNGWLTVEVVMVRLNQSYTAPNSSFQVYGELGSAANRTQIGFDAAICVEEVKGYVLDAYNNSAGSPVSLNLQYAGTQLNNSAVLLTQDSSKPDHPRKLVGDPVPGNVQHGISSAGKWAVYNASHYNARNIMLKDNGRDWWFVPNPTVVAFGGGMAPTEYTKLNPANIARVLSNSDSQHLLPYLVGTQPVIAYEFRDNTVAYTQIYAQWLAVTLAVVLIAGIIVSVFVPRLPLGVSRKDIGVTSWLAAIEDDPSAKAHLSPIAGERFERLRRRVTRWGNTRR